MLSALDRLAPCIRRAKLDAALGIVAVAVAAYTICAPFVACKYPPMTDFPFHAAQAATFRHYTDPSFHLREQFDLRPFAVPYVSLYLLGAALMWVFPTLTAMKIAAALTLALLPAGLAVLFHGMRKSPLLGLLGLGLVWCNLTHWGFINAVGALGLFAMAVGFAFLVVDRPTRARGIGLSLTLIALFFTHIFRFPFAVAAVIGTAVVMYPATRRFSPIALPLVPPLLLFAAWLRVRPPTLGAAIGPLWIHKERIHELGTLLYGAFTDPAEAAAFSMYFRVTMAVFALCFVTWTGSATARFERHRVRWDACAALVPLSCAAVFLAMFFVLPMWIGMWWYVYPREATTVAFVLLAACPDLPRGFLTRACLVAAIAFAVVPIARVSAANYALFDEPTRDFDAIASEIPMAPKLLYLIFDHTPTTRSVSPYLHLPAWIQADHGGWLSWHMARFGASPLAYRDTNLPGTVLAPPTPMGWEWRPATFNVGEYGAFFDWFLVRQEASPDALFAEDPTIVPVDHVGKWWLYKRQAAAGR